MDDQQKTILTVQTQVRTALDQVWQLWTDPAHIMQWNNASDDWHTTRAENDLRPGGRFVSRMEAKDGSFGFDFGGVYDKVMLHERIAYTLDDDRKVEITFKELGGETRILEIFEAENQNPEELQQKGWQAILDNFKRYAEATASNLL